MNTIMVSLSYPKTRFVEIKSKPEEAHHQKHRFDTKLKWYSESAHQVASNDI